MADTTARALRLLELLQSAQQRTVTELADRLGVDERTVRRDVARLVDLDVPVESLRGRYGGYRLAPGRRILPVVFSSAELVAVFLALAGSQAAAGEPGVPAQTALSKMRRALPRAEAERIDAALGAMTPGAQSPGGGPDPAVMLTLAEAVSRRQVLDLRYRDREGVPSRRTVHPYGLVAHTNRWYLVAFDTERGAERAFRVDRVRTARTVPGTFTPPERDDPAADLVEHFADADYRWRVVVRIRATHEHIRTHLPPSVARVQRVEESAASGPPWHRAEIHAETLDWLPSVIVALDCEVRIDEPEELRERVRAAAARMYDAASTAAV